MDKNHNFIDLLSKIFSNELILSKIFSYLSLRDLSICREVCYKWQIEAKRVIVNRSESLNIFHFFRTDDSIDGLNSGEKSQTTDEDLAYCSHWFDKYDFESNAIKSMNKSLQSIPEICLLVYGSFGEDVKLKQRLYQTEVVRRSLPDNDCRIVNLNSQCLIGFPTTSDVPVEKISHFDDLAAVSMLLFPKYRSDSKITVFSGSDMRQKIFNLNDIKAIVIFTTSSIFQDNRNLYLEINSLSKYITQKLDNRIAFGGYNSAYFSFNKTDFLNYTDRQPFPVSDGSPDGCPLEAHELIGLCFSGPELRASSLNVNTKEKERIVEKLIEFKNRLDFNPLSNRFQETIVFMFTDEEKSDAFAKLEAFQMVFPGCRVYGISGYGQYGYDYWPAIDVRDSTDLKTKSFSSFVTNNKKPSNRNRIKRRIVLNTNMTTFVVIKVPKKFF